MPLINTAETYTIYNTVAEAEEAAAANRAIDEEWTYLVVPDPKGSGRAIVRILDEDGDELGKL